MHTSASSQVEELDGQVDSVLQRAFRTSLQYRDQNHSHGIPLREINGEQMSERKRANLKEEKNVSRKSQNICNPYQGPTRIRTGVTGTNQGSEPQIRILCDNRYTIEPLSE